jgi:hypothetical protein
MKKILIGAAMALSLLACTDPVDLDDNIGKYQITKNVDENDDLNAVQWDESVIKHLAVGNIWEYEYTNSHNNKWKYSMKVIGDTVIGTDTFAIVNNSNIEITCQTNKSDGLYIWEDYFNNPTSAPVLSFRYPMKKNKTYSFGDSTIKLIDTKRKVQLDFGEFECYLYRQYKTGDYGDAGVDYYFKPGLGLIKKETYPYLNPQTDEPYSTTTSLILTSFEINADTTGTN